VEALLVDVFEEGDDLDIGTEFGFVFGEDRQVDVVLDGEIDDNFQESAVVFFQVGLMDQADDVDIGVLIMVTPNMGTEKDDYSDKTPPCQIS
jgi:hypothetical protein